MTPTAMANPVRNEALKHPYNVGNVDQTPARANLHDYGCRVRCG